ncbi:hypothetical protein [uncultured Reyranella sp.]|uniref:hypothetical protein n=1 Tax=uncultured Reyranella sp. TaxID=735512 RepID=UPI0025E9AE43|nr:hypothetical protein [uncultured Reyranella sp.]
MPVIVEGITTAQLGRSIADWVKAATIETAERALREEVARGFDNDPVVITDGMPRRDYLQVRPFGRIEFAARTSMAEAVRWALTELQKKSPVLTGRYASSHTVMINGAEVEGNIWVALRNVRPTDRVQIVNPQPYARKIEGATANRRTRRGKRAALSRQARSGVYRVVLRALVNRFGKALFFDFKYVNLNIGIKVWGKRGAQRVQRDQVYPALQFFIKPTQLPA